MSSSVAWRAAGRRAAICSGWREREGGREREEVSETFVDEDPSCCASTLLMPCAVPVLHCCTLHTRTEPPCSPARPCPSSSAARPKTSSSSSPAHRPRRLVQARGAGWERRESRRGETHCVWKGELARGYTS